MSTTKHTPGPWQAVKWQKDIVPHISGPNGESIAELYRDPDGSFLPNARLIAAAPDLLVACKNALEDLEWLSRGENSIQMVCGIIPELKKAIKQAEGSL